MADLSLHLGDCREVMAAMDAASVDAVITDPPYELGFMGRSWDASGIAYDPAVWRECLRMLRPGGHLVAFGGTRTYHRLACAVEDVGFEIRDSLHWIYGSGFPKSRACLKPSHEPIVLARKPAGRMVPLNINGCRVNPGEVVPGGGNGQAHNVGYGAGKTHGTRPLVQPHAAGRWPPNVLLGPEAAAELDAQSGNVKGFTSQTDNGGAEAAEGWGTYGSIPAGHRQGFNDSGGASRFFPVFRYQAKAPRSERPAADGVKAHPTVKPVDLMRWLVRLVTPPGGLVLDPFAGTGTTGEACLLEGFRCVLIERDPDYVKLARARLGKPIQPQIA